LPFDLCRSTFAVRPLPFDLCRSTFAVRPLPFDLCRSTFAVRPVFLSYFILHISYFKWHKYQNALG
jgi:hypothetical protein